VAPLITGGEGFVGRNLNEYFVKQGYEVLAPTVAELDLIDDVAVAQYFSEHAIDSIIHSATTLRDGTSYPPDTCEHNLRMFFNLARELQPSMKLINLGSGSEYARAHWHSQMQESFFGENVPHDSHSYAKYLISQYIEDQADPNLIGVRIFGIFGKYEDYRYKFISNAIAKNLCNLPIVINQNVLYDYMPVEDFSRLAEVLLKTETTGRVFNATPTIPIDLVTIAKLINEASENEVEVQVLNDGMGTEYTGNNSALLNEIGDFQFSTMSEAISNLYNHYASIKDSLDEEALREDAYLNYAKSLKTNFFK